MNDIDWTKQLKGNAAFPRRVRNLYDWLSSRHPLSANAAQFGSELVGSQSLSSRDPLEPHNSGQSFRHPLGLEGAEILFSQTERDAWIRCTWESVPQTLTASQSDQLARCGVRSKSESGEFLTH